MESENFYGYATTKVVAQAAPAPVWPHSLHHAVNPPASRQVFERLAHYLTPPRTMILRPTRLQVRSGAYDKLAVHCEAEAHKPAREVLWAYDACKVITRYHSKSFYLSARLLPQGKREGSMALYAFCRLSDDIVDNAGLGENQAIARAQARLTLNTWAKDNAQVAPRAEHPVVIAWSDTRNRFGIPQHLADELLEGIRMDLSIQRYETWDDLWLYCYRVASTVGLMSMYITGTETMDAVPYAVQLGVALQLTNILRDVGDDAEAGRIYIPREDMHRFGYTEEMLLSGEINEQFVSLMKFEIERARTLYAAAEHGIAMLPRDSRFAIHAASTLYRGILGKIEQAQYDVFNRRAHLSATEKLGALPGIWKKSRSSNVKREA